MDQDTKAAVFAGDKVDIIVVFFIHNVPFAVALESSNAQHVRELEKENDILMKRNNANNATKKELRHMIIV